VKPRGALRSTIDVFPHGSFRPARAGVSLAPPDPPPPRRRSGVRASSPRPRSATDPARQTLSGVPEATAGASGGAPSGGGGARARSHWRYVQPLIRCIPYVLMHSAPLFLKRQCDPTLGGARLEFDAHGGVVRRAAVQRGCLLERLPAAQAGHRPRPTRAPELSARVRNPPENSVRWPAIPHKTAVENTLTMTNAAAASELAAPTAGPDRWENGLLDTLGRRKGLPLAPLPALRPACAPHSHL
jgi:hypothetical protein